MTERNSFQDLMAADEKDFKQHYEYKVQSRINGTLGLFRFVGDLLNIFVPRIADVLILGLGGHEAMPGSKEKLARPSLTGRGADPGSLSENTSETDEQTLPPHKP